MGFTSGSDGKESACNAGDLSSITGLGRSPGGGHGNPLQCSCLKHPNGQRSLASHSPWGCQESDMTEQLSTQHKVINAYYNFELSLQFFTTFVICSFYSILSFPK